MNGFIKFVVSSTVFVLCTLLGIAWFAFVIHLLAGGEAVIAIVGGLYTGWIISRITWLKLSNKDSEEGGGE